MSSASFQSIIDSIETLSLEEQDDLLALFINRRIAKEPKVGNFWDALQNFRAKIERENIVFNDDNLADIRDKSPGREVEL